MEVRMSVCREGLFFSFGNFKIGFFTKLDANVHVQSNCEYLDNIARTVGEKPIDLIIEDGSHNPGHQLKTVVKLFPRVARGGLSVIEDMETSFWDVPGAEIYGAHEVNGAGRQGSIVTTLKI